MPSRLNRRAYEQLIEEDVEVMESMKKWFTQAGKRLEWDHIVDVLRASPDREYGEKACPLTT